MPKPDPKSKSELESGEPDSKLVHQRVFLPSTKISAPAEILKRVGLKPEQIKVLHGVTPTEFLQERKGRGGMIFTYVDNHYMTAMLNFIFGMMWEEEYYDYGQKDKHLWVRCKLTVTMPNGQTARRQATGSGEMKMLKDKSGPVDIGDDWKATEADALKKAASKFGIAWDVYAGITTLSEGTKKPYAKKIGAHNKMMMLARELGLTKKENKDQWHKHLKNRFPKKTWSTKEPSSKDLSDEEKWEMIDYLQEEKDSSRTARK